MCKPLLLVVLFLTFLLIADYIFNDSSSTDQDRWSEMVSSAPRHELSRDFVRKIRAVEANKDCHFASDCFDIYKCGDEKLKVYIYPPEHYVLEDEPVLEMSEEMFEILETVFNSDYYTPDPDQACLFLPSVDLLNTENVDSKLVASVLYSLSHWNRGRNHLILNILHQPGSSLPSDLAILLTPDHSKARLGYDLTTPALSQIRFKQSSGETRKYLLGYPEMLDTRHARLLTRSSDLVTSFSTSPVSQYKKTLTEMSWCLVTLPADVVTLLTDCLAAGAIPVLLTSAPPSLPLSQLIDWSLVSVQFRPSSVSTMLSVLQSYSPHHVTQLRTAGARVYSQYLQTPAKMTLVLLKILETRQRVTQHQMRPAPALPVQSEQGFTTVILTYDREKSLFQVIKRISQVDSLVRILVIWNHQSKSPPPAESWPRINKPLKVIQTSSNKLSNRFYPYDEIETECVLSLDDDISMLTVDELEFGYQVWREFPDRIVGFPPRTHVYDNVTGQYKYESEWVNDVSLVLTGVSFYHKFWHYTYTASPSQEQRQIKEWVDKHINCEDIAFNLMVANATGKAPIKVGPRKKFKCLTPSCENSGMLSASASHLEERSKCLDQFVSIYGFNPLKTVQFRADPVLYKENFPLDVKLFNDIGTL